MEKKTILPFDMSLRLWSDTFALDDVGVRLNVPVKHLQLKGRPWTDKGPAAGRLAKRHYVSLANEKGTTFDEATDWLRRTIQKLAADRDLARQLETRQVESLFWIAMFGRDPVPTPALTPDLVASLVCVHSEALIENYTPVSPDYPTKTWFPAHAE